MGHAASRTLAAVSGGWCVRRPWLVIAGWVTVVVGLNVVIPQLEQTVAAHSVPFLPSNIAAAQTLRDMSNEFGVPQSSSIGSIVLVNENGITEADQHTYERLVAELRSDTADVAYILDTYSNKQPREIGLSPDGKAINLMVAATGDVGSTTAHHNTMRIRALIDQLPKPPGLQIYYTGPSPTLADLFSAMDVSLLIITGVSVLVIAVLLLMVYRSMATALVPLVTIGVALGVARPVISLLGMTDTMAVSNFTIALMTAMVLGATTDYAIFILAGYHEGRRDKVPVGQALAASASRVNGILVASALTIAVAAAAMGFTQLGLFRAAGPPIVVAITIALAVSLTLPFALIGVLGQRGLAEPGRLDTRRWRRIGVTVIRRSVPLASVSLAALMAGACVLPTLRVNFDEKAMLLDHTDSTAGYDAVQRHWGLNEAAPEYLIVGADHDMRNTSDLAALDRIAAAVATLPEVAHVRFLTRPTGEQLKETTVGYQVGVVSNRLSNAHDQVQAARPDLARLSAGVSQLHDSATAANAQLPALVTGVTTISALAHTVLDTYQSANIAVNTASGGRANLEQIVHDLLSSLALVDAALSALSSSAPALATLSTLGSTLAPVVDPQPGPDCLANPLCMRARSGLADLDALSDGAVTRALRQAQPLTAAPDDSIARARQALPAVRATLTGLQSLLAQTQGQSPAQTAAQLNELMHGAERLRAGMTQLADGLGQVRAGVGQVVDLTELLGGGLQEASDYLHDLSIATSRGPGTGFYLPPQGFTDQRFRAAEQLLLSPDGKTARMVIAWKINPYGHQALDTAHQLANTAATTASTTSLHDAHFATTGLASLSADMRDQMWRDFATFGLVAILGVLAVLIALLRSVIAPLFMVSVVVLSFATAAGVSVLIWQHLIGIDLDWSVLPVSFMALIAVGADYSMLFAARIREESRDGMVRAIIRGFGSTGGVITTAGLVFALTMFALMSGRVVNLLQIGFTIGAGLLIDITIVRTILLPAALHLIGDRIWWPSRRAHHEMRRSGRPFGRVSTVGI